MEAKHERMTTQEIEAIRKRAEAATGGPWNVIEFNEGNTEFIVHSREDIPALLAEVARLRRELNGDGLLTLQDQVDHARDYIAELIPKYDDMTSIALWSARRLPKIHKDFAYNAIEANLGREVERL